MKLWVVDLDEVVFNFVDPYFEFINKRYGLNISRHGLTHYSAEKSGLIEVGMGYKYLKEFTADGGFKRLPLMPGAKESLEALIRNGHQFVIVTSRIAESRADTHVSLQKSGIPSSTVFFSGNSVSKGMIANALNADEFVDDNPKFIDSVLKHSPETKTVLMTEIAEAKAETSPHLIVASWEELKQIKPELQ